MSVESSSNPIPMTFVRRMTRMVFAVFLVTMLVFLVAAYRAETRLYAQGVFEHLEETSAVLVALPEVEAVSSAPWLADIERRLAAHTGVAHRVVVTDSEFTIKGASNKAEAGEDIRQLFGLEPFSTSGLSRATGHSEDVSWLVSSQSFGSRGQLLFLMRSNDARSGVLKRFLGLHVLHVGVTLVLFFVLMRFLGERFIRRPIQLLAAHVRRIEAGEFESHPEIYEDDEFGWLAERFTEMGLRLRESVRSLVRMEKLASAGAVAYRAARESAAPLYDLRNQIAFLEAAVEPDDEAILRIARSLKKDHRLLVDAVVGLQKMTRPDDGEDKEPQAAP